MGVWGFVYFGMLDSGVAWVAFLAVCLGLVPHAMHYGPQAALIAESFPTSLRYGGSGLGYQFASLIAGGPAPLVATFLLHQFGTGYAISAYILVSALITLAACAALPDRSRADISDDATYAKGWKTPATGVELGPRTGQRAQSLVQASSSTERRICSISSKCSWSQISGGESWMTGSPRSSARQ